MCSRSIGLTPEEMEEHHMFKELYEIDQETMERKLPKYDEVCPPKDTHVEHPAGFPLESAHNYKSKPSYENSCKNCVNPCENSTKPCENSTKPCENSTKPCENSIKPSENCQRPYENSTKPCEKSQNPYVDSPKNPDHESYIPSDISNVSLYKKLNSPPDSFEHPYKALGNGDKSQNKSIPKTSTNLDKKDCPLTHVDLDEAREKQVGPLNKFLQRVKGDIKNKFSRNVYY